MKTKYTQAVIILRKQIIGEHSIEELAYRLGDKLNIPVICMPYHSTSILNLLKNIKFIKNVSAKVYYIISPSEAYLLPFLKGKKIITYHDIGTLLNSRNFIYRFIKIRIFLKPSIKHADIITFVSQQSKKEYSDFLRINNDNRLKVIYNSFNPDFLIPMKKKRNSCFTILHVGTAPRKNLINVLYAIKDLNVKIVIVGKLRNEQKKVLAESSINYENYFDISTDKLIDLYKSSDLISFPSSYEGFGMPIIEANAAQIPIITGNIDILHEVGNNAAFYVNGENVDSIKNGIKQLMFNDTLRTELVSNGIENIKRFSEDNIYKQYKEILGV